MSTNANYGPGIAAGGIMMTQLDTVGHLIQFYKLVGNPNMLRGNHDSQLLCARGSTRC